MIVGWLALIRIHGYIKQASTLHDDFLQLTLCGFLGFGFICSALKNINVLLHQSDIKYIGTNLQWEITLPCSEETGNLLQRHYAR